MIEDYLFYQLEAQSSHRDQEPGVKPKKKKLKQILHKHALDVKIHI